MLQQEDTGKPKETPFSKPQFQLSYLEMVQYSSLAISTQLKKTRIELPKMENFVKSNSRV